MKVVGIHGIAHEYSGAHLTGDDWFPALQDGLENAGASPINREDFAMVSYGSLFRPPGTRAGDIPKLNHVHLENRSFGYRENSRFQPGQGIAAKNVEEGWETELLTAWWREAARLSEARRSGNDSLGKELGEDSSIQGPDFEGRGRSPAVVQRALRQLAKSRFFRAWGRERVWIFGLKQVGWYLHDPEIKQKILQRVNDAVSADTRVIIGHSLGSIVAYEALCEDHPDWNVHTLVTLGSPLGIDLIFDSLTPKPKNGVGVWPNVKQWFNIADKGDIVALKKELASLFGPSDVIDKLVYNGWESHSAERYLTARETGQAIATGLIC